MRQKAALKRGRAVWILLAGGVGFLLGDWHAVAVRSTSDISPAENVALRFPEPRADGAVVAEAATDAPAGAVEATTGTSTMVLGNPQLALLSPNPMVPPSVPPQPAAQATVPQEAVSAPAVEAAPRQRPHAVANEPPIEKSSAAVVHRANRPGFVLNDGQIASIKARLHLTPDQERMWPAVEAALRNVAYAKEREAHRRGRPPGTAELASLDPDSAEVQGLKSAAFPLIMSFSDEQRNEVRSLAHVMGLDKLASEL